MRQVPAMRAYLAATGATGLATAGCVITQASLLAWILATGFTEYATAAQLAGPLAALAGVVACRAGLAYGQAVLGQRAAGRVKSTLRSRLLQHIRQLGPARLAGWRSGEPATLLTRGLDGLDPYVTGYLPKMITAAVLPAAVLARLAVADWASALIIAVTLPLIPIFAVLVGWHTRERTARQWGLLSRLGGHFLDVVAGLPTLRAFGRARPQVAVVHRIADAHRAATMRTLRVAFLSSLVLELVATLSVALVAVPVGLRLLGGGVELGTALLVLFLAPEAYLPLRAAGSAFHDSMEGVAVARRTFAVLDSGDAPGGGATDGGRPVALAGSNRTGSARAAPAAPDPHLTGLRLEGVTARYPGQATPALDRASLRVSAGERVALVGPSGAGKSTVLALLLRFLDPEYGRVLAGDTALGGLEADEWRRHLAWVPQRPHLFADTVAANIKLGRPEATMAGVRAAARAAAADEFIRALPHGYDTALGEQGAGLSAGQRQRLALARAFLRDAPLLLVDEPTAHLDPASEAAVADGTAALMAGRTAIVIAHRPALLGHVDRVVPVRRGRPEEVPAPAPTPHHSAPRAATGPYPESLPTR